MEGMNHLSGHDVRITTNDGQPHYGVLATSDGIAVALVTGNRVETIKVIDIHDVRDFGLA